MATFKLPYHRSFLDLCVADKNLAGVLESAVNTYRPGMSQQVLIDSALDNPIGSPRLEEIARGKKSITIITSDHTRPVPSRLTMPKLLERLRSASPGAAITILVATGYHRATTREELNRQFGESIVNQERFVIHDSKEDSSLVQLGILPSGGELWLNRLAIETDLLIAEGFIEPHFFAGFSGGRKSVLPGIAGYKTVLANHCSEFIAHESARTGILDNNPLHRDMLFAAEKVGLAFILNVVLNDKKEVIHAVAGHRVQAHQAGCNFLREYCQVKRAPADIVITTNGGYPLDQNIYQSVKGMTAAEATCKDNGIIIMVSAASDGHGGDSFYQNMADAATPGHVLRQALKVSRNETVPDQWEYQILARILDKYQVIFVTNCCDSQMIRDMHMDHAFTVDEALDMAYRKKGEDASVTVIPDGIAVIVQ